MKVRQGFVSNSSTSSFVILGYKINDTNKNKKAIIKAVNNVDVYDDEDELYDLISELDNDFVYKNEEEAGVNGAIVGIEILTTSDSSGCTEIGIDEFDKKVTKATEKLKTLSFIKSKPKIFFGVNVNY